MVKIMSPSGAFASKGSLAPANPSMEQVVPSTAPAGLSGQPLAPLPGYLQSDAQAAQLSAGTIKKEG